MFRKKYRLFLITIAIIAPIIGAKYLFHHMGWELVPLGSLHNGVVSGTIFVIGFLLSATIADYKESERIPAELSATLENMYEDARSIHATYPGFDLDALRTTLHDIALSFNQYIRVQKHGTSDKIHALSDGFAAMEKAGVPANFIVKLKQQQFQLTNRLFRVNYIQRIHFIPSATILARAISVLTLGLLLITEFEPFYGNMLIMAIIAFIMVYIQNLIAHISTPFHAEGKTLDDVSLFLVSRTARRLAKSQP